MSDDDIAIAVRDVSRMFKRFRHPRYRVLEALGLPLPKNAYDEFWALRDISLQVKRGDSLAIIGQNGAGKSTLLSIICGRLQSSSGSVRLRGEIQALMDLGTGFHPEFTGRQNVYSALAYQGVTGREADRRYEEIVEFSELEEFVDQPIKTYSTGMYARLAFSTATAIEPDVLIIDEILSAGDAYFASKCTDRMRRLTREVGATVLFVSHDISSVQRLCDHAIWLERGRIKMAGPTLDISKAYYAFVIEREEARLRAQTTRAISRMRRRAGLAENGETDGTLLLRLVTADGLPPRGSHAVSRIALVIADGRRLEVRLGEPMDNDETQDAYLMTDPKYMLWSPTKIVDGRTARCVENTGGVYTHAPICFRVTPDVIAASAAIEIEHAPDEAADDLALEIYNSRDYRRLGVLRARHSVGGWHVDTLPISLGVGCQENARTSPADRSAAATPEPAESDLGSQRRVLSVPHRGADPLPLDSPQSDGTGREKWESDEARFLDVSLCNHVTLAPQHLFGLGETISFRIIAELRTEVPVCWFAAIIYDDRGNRILLAVHKVNSRAERGQHEILLHLRNPNLRQGNYVVTLELLPEFDYNWHGPVRMPYLCHWDRCVFFSIDEGYHGSIDLGLVSLPGDFTIRRCTPHDNGDGTSSMAQLAK